MFQHQTVKNSTGLMLDQFIFTSQFIDFLNAIEIIRNDTNKWPNPSKMNIELSVFDSTTDSNMSKYLNYQFVMNY